MALHGPISPSCAVNRNSVLQQLAVVCELLARCCHTVIGGRVVLDDTAHVNDAHACSDRCCSGRRRCVTFGVRIVMQPAENEPYDGG